MKNLIISMLFLLVSSTLNARHPDTLIVGYNIIPPFVTEKNGNIEGPSVWLWEEIAKENNFHFVYSYHPLNDLLVGLSSGEIDVSLSPLTITHDRSEKMDFSAPYYIAHSSFLIAKTSSVKQFLDFIKSVLSINFFRALGALAFVILVFGLLVWLFERKHNDAEFGTGLSGLWSGFWWSAVTMTTVGYGDKSPRTLGGRVVALIWMFTAITIISGFTAGIASSLTVNQIGAKADHIFDFKDQKIGTIYNSGTDEWLRNNLFNNKVTFDKLEDLTQALQMKKVDAMAYDRPILQHLITADSLTDFTLTDIKYNPQFYAFGMNYSLPLKTREKINLSMLDITEGMEWMVVLSEYNLK